MKVTTAIILETRKPGENNTYPVKLRVTYNRNCKYYILRNKTNDSIYLTKSDFEKVMGERPREDFKKLSHVLKAHEEKAINDIESLPVFTFEKFERKYFDKSENSIDIISALQKKANLLKSEGRISTAMSYECSIKSIKKFTEKDKLEFERADVHFFNQYEKWMLKKNNSNTTISMYVRNIRTIFNEAERAGLIKQGLYPFGKDKYVIPGGRNVKKALTIKEVGLIANYKVKEGSSEHRYRDYWLFSYLCNGINVKDIANLKYANIDGEVIKFVRAKTQRENKANQRTITVVISKELGKIIDTWGNKPGAKENYIFPILEDGLTPEQEYATIRQATKLINRYVSNIAECIGIINKVTTYTARHSFATVLKRTGAPLEYISESLGHSNLATTENYLADFEIDEKRKWAASLTKF
jgi:integrase